MSKRLLLIGGGHSHVEVIRRFAHEPEPDAAITLVSPDRLTAYSGMLPGHVAGHYSREECHIDLEHLCRAAGITRVESTVTGLDLECGFARCGNEHTLPFDILSIDTGSVAATAAVAGADRHGIAVRPVAHFLQQWDRILASAARARSALRIAVVGAGAAGVELVLAMQHRMLGLDGNARFTLVGDGPGILPSHPRRLQCRFMDILNARGIELRLDGTVQGVDADSLLLRGGARIATDEVFWVTGAAAPPWPAASGLGVDARGFIAVNAKLQSMSHPRVFAAGDVASMVDAPRPKSGVYAVRQGPPLARNLRRALRGESLLDYRPQRRALALISAGDRYAMASYGALAWGGGWVWQWKDRIDRGFMQRYRVEGGWSGQQGRRR
ncbi:MAG: FAD-dependent oxidoreductase [Burkholderiales bacterium]|nr:FAD-dependent oxidoreductase [Burkholderiales bacterium]